MFCSSSHCILQATTNQIPNTNMLSYLFLQLTVNQSTKRDAIHALLCFLHASTFAVKCAIEVWIWMLMTLEKSRSALRINVKSRLSCCECMAGNAKPSYERNLYKYLVRYKSEGLFQTYFFFLFLLLLLYIHTNTHTSRRILAYTHVEWYCCGVSINT